jgi:hypothetical protein
MNPLAIPIAIPPTSEFWVQAAPYILAVYTLVAGLIGVLFYDLRHQQQRLAERLEREAQGAVDRRDRDRESSADDRETVVERVQREMNETRSHVNAEISKLEKEVRDNQGALSRKLDETQLAVLDKLDALKDTLNAWTVAISKDYPTRQEVRDMIRESTPDPKKRGHDPRG